MTSVPIAGHYSARRLVREMLRTHLAAQLTALSTHLGVDFVPDVDPVNGYYLTDVIPMDDTNPRVLISSATSDLVRSLGVAGDAPRVYDYAVTIAVTCTESQHLTLEQASISRDVLLLAVRNCTLLHRKLDDDGLASIVVDESAHEEVGPADVPDKLKRAVSVGEIPVTVRQHEQALSATSEIASATAHVDPLD